MKENIILIKRHTVMTNEFQSMYVEEHLHDFGQTKMIKNNLLPSLTHEKHYYYVSVKELEKALAKFEEAYLSDQYVKDGEYYGDIERNMYTLQDVLNEHNQSYNYYLQVVISKELS